MSLFRELKEETGVTLIVVTHDRAVGESAPRRIVLHDGRVATGERVSGW
jgi:ABC-type lipoprotein export system ATPase subunit